MKIWYHVIAAVVGLAIAALIVYLVFGNASQQGAVQEGAAPNTGANAAGLCGTIAPAETGRDASRTLAQENPPALFNDVRQLPGIAEDQPEQQSWVNRVHSASGLCIDELHITTEAIRVLMSTPAGMDEQDLGRYTGATIKQAFSKPLNRNRVVVITTVDGAERRIAMSARAWRAFSALKRPATVANIKRFRSQTGFKAADLRVVGW